jgi:thiol:disulfide interchange protein DsbD
MPSFPEIRRWLSLSLFVASGALAAAPSVRTKHVTATVLSSQRSVAQGQSFHVGLFFKIIPHWHVYWKNPGDSGEAPHFEWAFPEGTKSGEILWPSPSRIPFGPLANYGYEDEILFPVSVTVPENFSGKSFPVKLEANWLVCREECVPERGRFEISVPVGAAAPAEDESLFSYTLENIPQPVAELGASYEALDDTRLRVHVPLDKLGVKREDFSFELFPREGLFEAGVAHETAHDARALNFTLTLTPQALKLPENLGFVLKATALKTDQPSIALEFETEAPAAAGAVEAPETGGGFWFALFGAFLGGLLLNLMPCVLPVLSLKAFSVLKGRENAQASLKAEGLAYVFGILLSFWALAGLLLALRASGEALGWGFQLQNPVFVQSMILLFVALSLNFFGVFEIGQGLQAWGGRISTGESKATLRSSFLSGVLATLIATPCTAPFMGSAVGVALAMPASLSLLVFTSLGAGMALPVFVIYFFPSSLKALPRPGAWMESFKQFMGFPMLATAVWLLWVYGLQTDLDALVRLLFALLVLALMGWILGRFARSAKKVVALVATFALFLFLTIPLFRASPLAAFGTASKSDTRSEYSGLEHEAYSRERLEDLLREKRPVYVDFTAAWCLTCQVNKRIVFPDAEVRKLFAQKKIMILKGDWTDKNPALLAELERFGRSGVPLNLYYDPQKPQDPVVLPSVLRAQTVIDAMRQASP